MPVIEIDYCPRPQQLAIHRGLEAHRFGAVVAHRRMGKSVAAVNHLQRAALMSKNQRARFAYLAPTYTMGKSIIWDYLRYFASPIPMVDIRISELSVTYPNESQVRIYGADNPDSLRGLYFDGIVLDEYGLMHPRIFSEVIRPALSDRQGWALFLGTPAGKNQFYEVVQQAKADPSWFFAEYKASQTGVISQIELDAARKDMTADEYAQEYECSFEASVKGSIYAAELAASRAAGHVCHVPADPILPVDTDWDLGIGDSTSIWFSQSLRSGEIRIIDYYEASGEGLPHYAQVLTQKGYTYGTHWAPHDIQVRELASGRSRLESAASLGIRFMVVPNVPLEDGIHAARMLFPRCWFDETKCQAGLEALQHYRRDYNTRLNEFKPQPVHDWSEHACLIAGMLVTTRRGDIPIEDVCVNDEVWTPCGYARVSAAGPSHRAQQLVDIDLSDGRTLTCTPEHMILTNSGFKPAQALRYTDTLFRGTEWLCRMMSWCSTVCGIGFRAAITGEWDGKAMARPISIEPSGPSIMDRYPTLTTYTTLMGTGGTTSLRISNVFLDQNISGHTLGHCKPVVDSNLQGHSLTFGPWKLEEIQMGMLNAASHQESRGSRGVGWRVRVRTAVNRFCRRILRGRSGAISIVKWRHYGLLGEKPLVYDLTVEKHACYLANGVLVSNSSAFRYLAVRQQTPKDKQAAPAFKVPSGPSAWMS